jgi:hypothetical protein
MNATLLARIQDALDRVIEDSCEDDFWDEYLHPELTRQMADAAAAVFDASMAAQAYAEKEKS